MTTATLASGLDTRSALIHLEWLATPARSAAPDLRLEIAWGEPDVGPHRSRTFGLRDLSDAVAFAAWINRKGCNVYVGATLKSADAPPGRRCGADMAALATCLPVDSDNRFAEVANELAAITKTQLLILTGRVPETRGQLFVRIEPTSDFGTWETVHERIIRKCGGDSNARGGIRVSVKNLDGDNRADVVVGAGTGAGSRVTAYLGKDISPAGTPATTLDFDAFPGTAAGVFVG